MGRSDGGFGRDRGADRVGTRHNTTIAPALQRIHDRDDWVLVSTATRTEVGMSILRIITTLVILGLGVYVALSPGLVYAPTPRAVLFLFVAILPAILLADVATAHFEWKLLGFVATGGGSFAVMIIVLVALTYFTTSTDQVAVFQLYRESGREVKGLYRDGVVTLHTPEGQPIDPYVHENSIAVIFPDGTTSCTVEVRLSDDLYTGELTYYGMRKPKRYLMNDGTIQ